MYIRYICKIKHVLGLRMAIRFLLLKTIDDVAFDKKSIQLECCYVFPVKDIEASHSLLILIHSLPKPLLVTYWRETLWHIKQHPFSSVLAAQLSFTILNSTEHEVCNAHGIIFKGKQ